MGFQSGTLLRFLPAGILFRAGEGVPESVTGTRTETLPKADVKRVKDGIAADDKKQLDKILEDFCS